MYYRVWSSFDPKTEREERKVLEELAKIYPGFLRSNNFKFYLNQLKKGKR